MMLLFGVKGRTPNEACVQVQPKFKVPSALGSYSRSYELRYSPWLVYSQKSRVEVRDPLPKALTLFMTKICDILQSSNDLTKYSIPRYLIMTWGMFLETLGNVFEPIKAKTKSRTLL